jgi:hypothetical protein
VNLDTNRRWTLLFAGLGYLGAAIFYSYLVDIDANIQIFCLACPHLNALFLLVVGWSIILLVRFVRLRFRD